MSELFIYVFFFTKFSSCPIWSWYFFHKHDSTNLIYEIIFVKNTLKEMYGPMCGNKIKETTKKIGS